MESSEEGEVKYKKTLKVTETTFNHKIVKKIGEGTFGKVYLSTHKEKRYALKKIPIDSSTGLSITTIREIKILKQLRHRNIIEIIEIVVDYRDKSEHFDRKKCDLYVVFPYFEHDLNVLNRKRKFTSDEVRSIALQICEGLHYMHENNILHRDLKSENILLNDRLEVKIADFGLARYYEGTGSLTPGIVTLWYRAPEVLFASEEYDKKIDVWSLGCILGEMDKGRPIMMGKSEVEQLEMIVGLSGTINERTFPGVSKLPNFYKIKLPQGPERFTKAFEGFNKDAIDLLSQLLNVDPKKRPSTEEILSHQFLCPKRKAPTDLFVKKLRLYD